MITNETNTHPMNKTEMLLLAIAGWLTPLYPFFILTGVAIFADTILGIVNAVKKGKLSSRKCARLIYKILIYNLIVVSGYSLDVYLIGDFINIVSTVELTVTKAVVFGIILIELVSIDEKMRYINGKGFRHYWGIVKQAIVKINKEKKELE